MKEIGSCLGNQKIRLNDRGKKTFKWIPDKVDTLLDIGCGKGENISVYAEKAIKAYGIDFLEEFIWNARLRYPNVSFLIATAEHLPFKEEIFDGVILNDVLEHVTNEERTIKEAYRILKPHGFLILSVPHKGLFSFLDPENFIYHHSWIFKTLIAPLIREKRLIGKHYSKSQREHKHYFLKEIRQLLGKRFLIKKVFRSSCFLYPLSLIFAIFFGMIVKTERFKPILRVIREFDYCLPFGNFSYNMLIYAQKIP